MTTIHDHEADALPQAATPKKQTLTLEQFIDAMAHETIDGFESMDPLADPQPAKFYRPAMKKVLVHAEKRGPAFDQGGEK